MQLFFHPELEVTDTYITLSDEETRHCYKALRLVEGDNVLLTNGRGLKATGRLCTAAGKKAEIEIIESSLMPASTGTLCMAVAPTKNHDRYEWFVEKATEMGLQQLVPLICRHSERRNVQEARVQRVMVAALKQSQEYFLPELKEATDFETFIKQDFSGKKLIAWCGDDPKPHMKDAIKQGDSACILIGPEGDFSEQEVALAVAQGYIPISLGKKRLRTETAALAACHIYNLINES